MSLTRRTLRTTAAVAGMAALGVGLAGNALAAAAAPAALPVLADGNPVAAALPAGNLVGALPDAVHAPALAQLVAAKVPTIDTTHPSASSAPAAPAQEGTPTQAAHGTVSPRAGSTRTGSAQTGATRTGAARTGSTQTGSTQTGSTQTGSTQTGSTQTGSTQTAPAASHDQVGALSALDNAGMLRNLLP